ncbi:MAG: molybdopterin dehydrogenase FAD-binding [Firmicutes bacterium]|nr:molybdopterin dehydrogenase FAD-binding [Bacillota bacterium]
MNSFEYYAPESMAELLDILSANQENCKILAGGTDVTVHLREGKIAPQHMIALKKVPDLKGISLQGEKIVIGPMTTFTELAQSPIIRENAWVLAQAASTVGSPQIRNQGTVGGNIANASPAGDSLPALMALDAVLTIVSKRGEREMALEDFYLGISKNKLEKDEVVASICFPVLPQGCGSAFVKLGRRNALAISRVSAAAIIGYDKTNNLVTDCRVSVGSVAQNPFRVRSAEQMMLSCPLNIENRNKCVSAAFEEMAATLGKRASAVYKRKAGPEIVRRALDEAIRMAGGSWETVM